MRKEIILVSLVLFLVGCSVIASQPRETTMNSRAGEVSSPFIEITRSVATNNMRGEIVLSIQEANKERLEHWEQVVRGTDRFTTSVARLNKKIVLDEDLPVSIEQCGELAAYYDWKTSEVVTCYEMFDRFYGLFYEEYEHDAQQAEQAAVDGMLFILNHELGHAVIDRLDLPVTGREEDVADQFATLRLIEQGEGTAAIAGGEAFLLQGRDEGALPVWGEHSLDEQRYYNIMCWVYGLDKEEYQYLVDEGKLPKDRAKRCEKEFRLMRTSWEKILDPYEK